MDLMSWGLRFLCRTRSHQCQTLTLTQCKVFKKHIVCDNIAVVFRFILGHQVPYIMFKIVEFDRRIRMKPEILSCIQSPPSSVSQGEKKQKVFPLLGGNDGQAGLFTGTGYGYRLDQAGNGIWLGYGDG